MSPHKGHASDFCPTKKHGESATFPSQPLFSHRAAFGCEERFWMTTLILNTDMSKLMQAETRGFEEQKSKREKDPYSLEATKGNQKTIYFVM